MTGLLRVKASEGDGRVKGKGSGGHLNIHGEGSVSQADGPNMIAREVVGRSEAEFGTV